MNTNFGYRYPVSNFYRDQELLANQFCESENFAIWLSEKMRSYDNAADWLLYVEENLDIYKAEKYWLDLIGLVVGQSRVVPNAIPLVYFGFGDTPYVGAGFGQARFWNGVEPLAASSILEDPEYRTVLLAKIAVNYADSSLIGIAESLSIIFNTSLIDVRKKGTAALSIYIAKNLTDNEKALINELDLLPSAAGVSIDKKSASIPEKTFGFGDSRFNFSGFGVGKFVGSF
ncbi:MAG: hypothetical protein CMJ25_26245 [Phycisphaerae bacterium]|nr:hypothetical protein [Phycisphaerae bacterium]